MILYPEIANYIATLPERAGLISESRKHLLLDIADFIQTRIAKSGRADLLFVCTHNSRRSQLAQVFGNTLSAAYGYEGRIQCWSGGTEVTSFHQNAIDALRRIGFHIEGTEEDNPRYSITSFKSIQSPDYFSKLYHSAGNPGSGMAAIMVCTDADEACPYIPGAETRISLPYTDPKAWDGTDEQTVRYDSCALTISTELDYLFALLKRAP